MKDLIKRILKEEFIPDLFDYDNIMSIHNELLDRFGGLPGIRDDKSLKYCIEKVNAKVFGEELYPDLYTKLSVFLVCLIKNHPFSDGNKRTAFHVVKDVLSKKGKPIPFGYNQARPFLIKINNNEVSLEEISNWLMGE